MLTVTPSSLETFRCCPRKYWFAYVAQMVPEESNEHQTFGTIVHAGLQAATEHGKPQAGIDRMKALARDRDDLWKMCACFIQVWNHPGFQTALSRGANHGSALTEVEFAFDISDTGVTCRGKIDLLLRCDAEGLVVDFKTTSMALDTTTQKSMSLSPQIPIYIQGAKAHWRRDKKYEPPRTIKGVYLLSKKPTIKRKAVSKKMLAEIERTGLYHGAAIRNNTAYLYPDSQSWCVRDVVALDAKTPRESGVMALARHLDSPQARNGENVMFVHARTGASSRWVEKDIEQWAERIRAMEHDSCGIEDWPRNPSACIGVAQTTCPYLSLCDMNHDGMTIEGKPLDGYRIKTRRHEELSD